MAERQERPSAEEIVLYEKDPETKIATITLDRADDLNAMTDRRPAPLRRPRPSRQHRRRRQGARDPGQRPEPRQRRRPARAHGHHGRHAATSAMKHIVRIPEDADVEYPPDGRLPLRRLERAVLRRPRRRHAQPAGLQEDQHPRGAGLLLRLALLPSGRRRPRHLVRRRAVRPRRVPLRRLRGPQWQWCSMMGVRKFMEMVFTGPPVHRQGDVRLRLRQRGRAVRRARGDDREVRAGLLPVAARPTRSSPRRPSSRSTSSTRASTWAASSSGLLESLGRAAASPTPSSFEARPRDARPRPDQLGPRQRRALPTRVAAQPPRPSRGVGAPTMVDPDERPGLRRHASCSPAPTTSPSTAAGSPPSTIAGAGPHGRGHRRAAG